MPVFLPFTRPTLDAEDDRLLTEVLHTGQIASGPQLQKFEAELTEFFGQRKTLCFMHGTDALEIALKICGVGPGDEVIVPAMTFVASANVVLRAGAHPRLVDVDRRTRNVTLQSITAALTGRTRVVMPVHFAGVPVDMDAVHQLAQLHHLRVLEDACHAIGSTLQGRRIGTFGDLVAFSFHPNKNLTTIEGGALTFAHAKEYDTALLQRFHGIVRDEDHQVSDVVLAGGKSNLTDVAAALGRRQLRRLSEFNQKRSELAQMYFSLMRDDPLELPCQDEGHNWHLFAPLLPADVERKAFIKAMAQQGIGIGIHYPALPTFSLYRKLGYEPTDFPNAVDIGRRTVSLPLFPGMTEADVVRVRQAVLQAL